MATHKPDYLMTAAEAKRHYRYMQPHSVRCGGVCVTEREYDAYTVDYFDVSSGVVTYHVHATTADEAGRMEAEKAAYEAKQTAETEEENKEEPETMTLTQKLRTNRAALVEARQNHTTARETVAALIDAIGYENAAEIIAAMVNAKGEWDGRISRTNRVWAAEQNAPDRATLDDMCVWYCDEIHPAHMDEIATAMRNAEKPAEPQEEPEETEETAQERTDRENREHCKSIAENLEAYADGTVYRCPECGEVIRWDDSQYDDDNASYTCPHCGETFDESDLESLSVYDFIADALDIEIRCSLEREYRSARVMVAFGGPTIYIDTESKLVQLYWWNEYSEYSITREAADALDEAISEYWEAR